VRAPGGTWTRVGLAAQGNDWFAADLPLPAGGDAVVEYFLEARDLVGITARSPAAAPLESNRFVLGWLAERFEEETGWTVGVQGDGATQGRWVRAAPIGTASQPATDHTAAGSFCYVTPNVQAGAPASDGDVDGGRTTLLSPSFDLHTAAGVELEYWRWFGCDSSGDDSWRVEASPDAGEHWVELERMHAAAPRWERVEIDLDATLGSIHRLQLRFAVADEGAPSLVEAALDDVVLRVRTTTSAVDAPARISLRAPSPAVTPVPVHFALERRSRVGLTILDVRGRLVRTLVADERAAGPHVVTWDGRDGDGRRVGRGVYLLRLATDGSTTSTKLVLHAAPVR